MNPLETYLHDLNEIRSSGAAVRETSSYGPLASLFNEIGKTLKPKVKCIINLQNRGAGLPDGGFFTQEQFQKAGDHESMPGQMPARGAIEVKSTKDDALVTADGDQVTRYLGKYRQVLVTNYRDFVLVGQDASGQGVKLEIYRLADSEAAFWDAARHPRRTTQEHGERFTEYLKRVMLHAAPLTGPAEPQSIFPKKIWGRQPFPACFYKNTLYDVFRVLARRLAMSLPMGRLPFSISEIWLGLTPILIASCAWVSPSRCLAPRRISPGCISGKTSPTV